MYIFVEIISTILLVVSLGTLIEYSTKIQVKYSRFLEYIEYKP